MKASKRIEDFKNEIKGGKTSKKRQEASRSSLEPLEEDSPNVLPVDDSILFRARSESLLKPPTKEGSKKRKDESSEKSKKKKKKTEHTSDGLEMALGIKVSNEPKQKRKTLKDITNVG